MAYDSKFQHGLSWLNDSEEEKCSPKILTALYAAIYDENGDPDVVRHLLNAFDSQYALDNDEAPEPTTFRGEEAFQYLRKQYMKEAIPAYKRAGFDRDEDSLGEIFEWPSSLPYDYPIRRGILKSVAKRIAAADVSHSKALRAYALKADAETKVAS